MRSASSQSLSGTAPAKRSVHAFRGLSPSRQAPHIALPLAAKPARKVGKVGSRSCDAPMTQLALDHLPDLPQAHTISFLASRLWRDDAAVARWIGGSLARGAGDRYSDIDLRLAVRPHALASWRAPDFGALLGEWVVGRHFF